MGFQPDQYTLRREGVGGRYNRVMKLAVLGLLFGFILSAQNSMVGRLDATLQTIKAVHEPVSIVIAVPMNSKVQTEIDQNIRRIHALLTQLVGSDRGEIEVLSYGEGGRALVAQPFTSDSAKAASAIAHLRVWHGVQSSTSELAGELGGDLSGAIARASSDLETRPANRRRIIVAIGEASKEIAGAHPNVSVYPVAP
jgi:hypothetical protein